MIKKIKKVLVDFRHDVFSFFGSIISAGAYLYGRLVPTQIPVSIPGSITADITTLRTLPLTTISIAVLSVFILIHVYRKARKE